MSRLAAVGIVLVLLAITLPGLIGFHSITITGGSMGSALPSGSVAVTRTVTFRDVHVGDIIGFARPGAHVPVVHRIVEIRQSDAGPVAVTRGDANNDNDPDVLPLNQGSGDRVVYYVPLVGYALVFVRTPGGLIALTILGTITLLLRRNKRSSTAETHATPYPAI